MNIAIRAPTTFETPPAAPPAAAVPPPPPRAGSLGRKSGTSSGAPSRISSPRLAPAAARRAASQPSSDTPTKIAGASGSKEHRKARFAASSSSRHAGRGQASAASTIAGATKSAACRLIRSKRAPRGSTARGHVGRDLVDRVEGRQREVLVGHLDAVDALDERHELGQPEAVEDALVDQAGAVGGQQLAAAADERDE